MTFNVGTIQGGTRAGWRTVKQPRKDWFCLTCNKTVKSFWTSCPSCGGNRNGD